jgi:hypothetical protein
MLLLHVLAGALATAVAIDPLVTGRAAAMQPADPSTAASSAAPQQASDFRPQSPARAWKTIVLHHSATTGGSVASIDSAHRRKRDPSGRPWLGIGYHFVVGNGSPMADGEVQPTFRWQQQLAGAHAGNREHNEHGIGICLIGNFDEQSPSERQLAALSELIRTLAKQYEITRDRVVRHQDVQATRCPGKNLSLDHVLRTAFSDSQQLSSLGKPDMRPSDL